MRVAFGVACPAEPRKGNDEQLFRCFATMARRESPERKARFPMLITSGWIRGSALRMVVPPEVRQRVREAGLRSALPCGSPSRRTSRSRDVEGRLVGNVNVSERPASSKVGGIEHATLLSLRIKGRAIEPLPLGASIGATLRGAFGETLKRLVCAFDWSRTPCAPCSLRATCPFPRVFEPHAEGDAPARLADPPRPYVMKPPLDGPAVYQPGQTFTFGLVLFGAAAAELPYIVVLWRELAKAGIGPRRTRFRLESIMSVDETLGEESSVFDGERDLARTPSVVIDRAAIDRRVSRLRADGAGRRLAVRFLAPTLLKHEGRPQSEPAFHVLIRRLRDRASALFRFFGPRALDLDPVGLARAAEAVRTVEGRTAWTRSFRASRTGETQSLAGVTGRILFEGDIEPFLPLLALGEWLHVGKDCVFGGGRYELSGTCAEATPCGPS